MSRLSSPIGQARASGHEPNQIPQRSIVWAAIIMTLLVIGSAGVTSLTMSVLERVAGPASDRLVVPPPAPPGPRLLASPTRKLAELRAAEKAWLGSYDWVDREAGVVRISIDRAMELIAVRGVPDGQRGGRPPR